VHDAAFRVDDLEDVREPDARGKPCGDVVDDERWVKILNLYAADGRDERRRADFQRAVVGASHPGEGIRSGRRGGRCRSLRTGDGSRGGNRADKCEKSLFLHGYSPID
jgi:hypothetical protein